MAVNASVQAEDDCDDAPEVNLISITSNEPDQGTCAEDLPDDIQGAHLSVADFDFALRSERAEESAGRTYTVCYEARDESAQVTLQCATVNVPHDRRQ